MSDLSLEICYLSASQALKMFKNKTLSPVELLNEIKKRIDDINPKITKKYWNPSPSLNSQF